LTTIVTRAGKGSPLTNTEVDTNFTNLNTAKLESTDLKTVSGVSLVGSGDVGAIGIAYGGTGATTAAEAFSDLTPLTLTTASATPLVLTNTSSYQHQIVGSTTQTITLPSTATLAVGWSFLITNATGFTVTVQTSTGATVYANANIGSYRVWCVSTANDNAASWSSGAETFSFETGTGSVVRATAPTFAGISATGTLTLSGSTSSTCGFATSVTTGAVSIVTTQSSGTLTIGGTSGTGTQTIGRSTVSQTTNIQAGATASGSTKTMNIGTGGLAGSTTNIAIGSTAGTSTTNLQGVLQINSSAGTAGQVLTSGGAGVAATWASAAGATITDDTTTNATRYIIFDDVTSGSLTSVGVSSTKLFFNPSTGTLTSTVHTSNSDERLKENWTDVTPDFIEKLADVKHGIFSRIDSGNREAGVTAQSLQTVLPEAVVEGADGYLSVNYGGAALVAAVQLAKVVEELRVEVARLKAKVGE
jgi:hypothetical protein